MSLTSKKVEPIDIGIKYFINIIDDDFHCISQSYPILINTFSIEENDISQNMLVFLKYDWTERLPLDIFISAKVYILESGRKDLLKVRYRTTR